MAWLKLLSLVSIRLTWSSYLLNISFQIQFTSKGDNSGLSRPFRLLGYLSLAQLAVSAAVQVYSAWKTADRNADSTLDIGSGKYVSVQCLEENFCYCCCCRCSAINFCCCCRRCSTNWSPSISYKVYFTSHRSTEILSLFQHINKIIVAFCDWEWPLSFVWVYMVHLLDMQDASMTRLGETV